MMKAVQAAALFLMMMMMMMSSVSAFLLPPSINDSTHADQVSPHLLNNSDSTRFESRQNVNNSLGDIPGRGASNTMNGSRSSAPRSEEILQQPNKTDLDSTNRMVGHVLQSGGDERAGQSSYDPFGHRK
ncbi:uncharacterized protein zgc:193726 isoform X1 [Siniperca chuatsi]|uniref:uncharacterized protein zgc:193726 isoform X1 n=1 Tax=Siniperca chuatsi TaxID=119488 RepID=UPI001CE166ED|nr:uncharacterized protein zgc:193726 isoform X1 [Siniperca chuatsi]